jgi:hypothetical protein
MRSDIEHQEKYCSRRAFLSTALAAPLFAAELSSQATNISIASPDGKVRFEILPRERLSYRVIFRNQTVIDTSALGIVIDGVDLGESVKTGKEERYRLNERYAWRGVHSEAISHCNGAKISFKHAKSDAPFTLEVRAFNDGIAFRYVVPGDDKPRTPDETTAFTIPAGSVLWYHDFEGHYEGMHARKEIAEAKDGEWAAPPLTIELPNGAGYASITEAALINYAGMGLQAGGKRDFNVRLGHAHPPSYPFRLRYAADVVRLMQPAAITGTITTPWRVVMIGADLNALVNCDIVNHVSPPPDKKLFPAGIKTDWLKPGRAVWKYLDLYQTLLREAAEYKLILDFHGANKPAGEARTWPNEMTREGIYGLEHRRTPAWAPVNTVLPFTRMLAGHADYTPVHFGERRKESSWAHQIASAAIFTSPLLIYGAHPKNILANPAVEIIKSIPSVWDETIALSQSEIGELAAFARRSGSTWFLVVMNGSTARAIKIPLSFLGSGKYQALMARDQQDEAAAVKIENATASRGDALSIELRAGGGFIGRFIK